MAIGGVGTPYDKTFKIDDNLKTITTQYMVVSGPPTTTATDNTVQLSGDTGSASEPTTSAYYPVGVNQVYLSGTVADTTVRMFGISKAICNASIPAFTRVKAAAAGLGKIETVDLTATITVAQYDVGQAMESGSTNTVISIMVNPKPIPMLD